MDYETDLLHEEQSNEKTEEAVSENNSSYEPIPVEELKELLNQCGFKVLGIYDQFKFKKYTDKSEKIFFVCKG